MNFLSNIYHTRLAENDKNLRFWEDYLKNLKSLDFSVFSDKLKVPVLVPVGSRILFRGELKHTNEVTVALGADYFTKCSLQQAEILRQHRIKDAESKLETFLKEREYIKNQVSFTKQNVFENEGQEIIEEHTADEDKAWRDKHREYVRQWKQKKSDDDSIQEVTDEELWNRLEELELQEELDNELNKEDNESKGVSKKSFIGIEETVLGDKIVDELETKTYPKNIVTQVNKSVKETESKHTDDIKEMKLKFTDPETMKPAGNFDLLKKVIDKQNELQDKLYEIQNKDRSQNKTEQDLIAKLDEMDELEELQDEMDRIEDIIATENVESDDESSEEEEDATSTSQAFGLKRRVSFADEDESETVELTFRHSDIQPCKEPYDSKKGIAKPSDVYEAYSSLFTEPTSILKKTKCKDKDSVVQLPKTQNKVGWPDEEINREKRVIVVKDVVENMDVNENKHDGAEKRPISLFKQRRQQKS